jgi:hypothetical protein
MIKKEPGDKQGRVGEFNDWHADDYVENPYGSDDSVVDLTSFGESPPP